MLAPPLPDEAPASSSTSVFSPPVPDDGPSLVRKVARIAYRSAQVQQHAQVHQDSDWVAQELPLEIRVNNYPLSVVMRTPGHDEELVWGFLISESIAKVADILRVKHCDLGLDQENVMQVSLRAECGFDPARYSRHLYVSTSCGVCGKRSIKQALAVAPAFSAHQPCSPHQLMKSVVRLRDHQPGYLASGGLHGAALIDTHGEIVVAREDVGRHNAVDKALGWAIKSEYDVSACALLLSGRASFEMIQKALAARIGTVVAVGGVSSLAVELAEQAKINLFGFASDQRLNQYRTDGHVG